MMFSLAKGKSAISIALTSDENQTTCFLQSFVCNSSIQASAACYYVESCMYRTFPGKGQFCLTCISSFKSWTCNHWQRNGGIDCWSCCWAALSYIGCASRNIQPTCTPSHIWSLGLILHIVNCMTASLHEEWYNKTPSFYAANHLAKNPIRTGSVSSCTSPYISGTA